MNHDEQLHLKVGDPAPDFSSTDQNGLEIKLSDYRGKKLVLYFYPKDLTPGCTMQSKNLNENLAELKSKGYQVLGVSADSAARHCKFIEKYGLEFPLLADESKDVITSYGVWGRKKFMGREYDGIIRRTFIIDEKGIIKNIIDKVKTKDHARQILDSQN